MKQPNGVAGVLAGYSLAVFCDETAISERNQVAHQFKKATDREPVEWVTVGHRDPEPELVPVGSGDFRLVTLNQAWASHKSFRPKDGSDDPPAGGGRNVDTDWKGKRRSNDTHVSSTIRMRACSERGGKAERRAQRHASRWQYDRPPHLGARRLWH